MSEPAPDRLARLDRLYALLPAAYAHLDVTSHRRAYVVEAFPVHRAMPGAIDVAAPTAVALEPLTRPDATDAEVAAGKNALCDVLTDLGRRATLDEATGPLRGEADTMLVEGAARVRAEVAVDAFADDLAERGGLDADAVRRMALVDVAEDTTPAAHAVRTYVDCAIAPMTAHDDTARVRAAVLDHVAVGPDHVASAFAEVTMAAEGIDPSVHDDTWELATDVVERHFDVVADFADDALTDAGRRPPSSAGIASGASPRTEGWAAVGEVAVLCRDVRRSLGDEQDLVRSTVARHRDLAAAMSAAADLAGSGDTTTAATTLGRALERAGVAGAEERRTRRTLLVREQTMSTEQRRLGVAHHRVRAADARVRLAADPVRAARSVAHHTSVADHLALTLERQERNRESATTPYRLHEQRDAERDVQLVATGRALQREPVRLPSAIELG